MLMIALAVHLAVQTPAADSVPDSAATPADTAAVASVPDGTDAYMDADAREMVRRARERIAATDHSITGYRMVARERISAGLRALRRDRILYRRELAAEIVWLRDGVGSVEVLGAREVVPIAVPKPDVPDGVAGDAADLAFDPGEDLLVSHLGGNDGIRNPLASGSEADYRFATGDTTAIRLPSGRVVRLVELRVVPRRPHGLLLRGSLWLEMDSFAAVRGTFRLAAPLDIGRDLEDEDDDDIPGILQPMVAELRYLTVDYGLWEDRWWMPRLIALEGEARIGSLARVPIRFERSYEDYRVTGAGMPPIEPTVHAATADAREPDDSTSGPSRSCDGEECWRYYASTPADSVLIASTHLPPSIYGDGALISEGEIRELGAVLGLGSRVPAPWRAPVVRLAHLRPELVRYNRVEGLALGMEVTADFGAARGDATAWLGAADLEPNAEIGLTREAFAAEHRVAVYRRLEAVGPAGRVTGIGSVLSAFLLGRDDNDYYRALGVELGGRSQVDPGRAWRIFVERQTAAVKGTDLSAPWIFDRSAGFHDNIAAARADQVGAEVSAGLSGGEDPLAVRWSLSGSLLAETGDFTLARPGLTAFLGFPLPFETVGAVEVAGGVAIGDVPVQRLFYLGGPQTVRGYGGPSRVSGDAFWRGRAEIGSAFPGARVALFSDAGWAGPRGALELDPLLLSAGVGASFLDGLIRVDLARAMRSATGWRVDVYLDGVI